MNDHVLYTTEDITRTYEQVHDLLLTRYIIKSYSSNKSDIRDIAIQGMNFKRVKRVLELGCGYGFFIEKLKGRLHDGAVIIGIDIVENNREPFLNSVASIRYKGEFITGSADIIREMAHSSFDLVITSYSLYFFPYLLSDIARILNPDGVFIAITHSKNTLNEVIKFISSCIAKAGLEKPKETILHKLFFAFSLEEGKEQLDRYFSRVERIDFRNSMIFSPERIQDCIFYIQKKRNLIYKEVLEQMPDKLEEVQRCVEKSIIAYSHKRGSIVLNKDDAVFRCCGPRN